MKYGIREICEVVFRAKSEMQVGNKHFYKHEPVIYFDSLKTSTLEGAATTVYATGGRGNSRLIAWEGERTVTFTMEDALISTIGMSILTGAGVIAPTNDKPIIQHVTETVLVSDDDKISVSNEPYIDAEGDMIYVIKLDSTGDMASEPYIYTKGTQADGKWGLTLKSENYKADDAQPKKGDTVLVDYYTAKKTGMLQVEITPDQFGGNFYIEASTLFRDTDGVDRAAEFIIPNAKVQSNFTFTMASSGDPSTFTFTLDAFPDFTRFDKTKKVYCAIQIADELTGVTENVRKQTDAEATIA